MTNEEKQELLNAIKAESTDVSELDVATSLAGVESLPAMQGWKLVSVPVSLLAKRAEDANVLAGEALHGATARFSEVVESATVLSLSMTAAGGEIVYVRSAKTFAYRYGGKYYNNWAVEGMPESLLYKSPDFSTVAKNKVYVTGNQLYVWSEEKSDLVQVGSTALGISYEIIQ